MFIDYIFYKELPQQLEFESALRDRFRTYYADLMHCYQLENNINNSDVKFVSMEYLLSVLNINGVVRTHLDQSDLLIRPLWQTYLDPDHCSESLFIKNKFKFKNHIIDIGNVGNLCVQSAFSYSNLLMMSQAFNKICLISLESSTKQIFRGNDMKYSEINFVSLLSITKDNKKHGIEIIDVFFENDIHTLQKNIKENKRIQDFSNINVMYRFNVKDYIDNNFLFVKKENIFKIKYALSSGFLVYCLNKLMLNKKANKKMYLIVDTDVETKRVAGVLVSI